jgi:hypothetical protein
LGRFHSIPKLHERIEQKSVWSDAGYFISVTRSAFHRGDGLLVNGRVRGGA